MVEEEADTMAEVELRRSEVKAEWARWIKPAGMGLLTHSDAE